MQRFYFGVILLAASIGGTIELGVSKNWFLRPTFGWEIIAILTFFTGFVFFKLDKTPRPNFTQTYLLTIVLKILFGGILIAFILFMDAQMAVENALVFIISYLLFTSLEVFFLFRKINKTTKTNG
jgi:hypothetical protein